MPPPINLSDAVPVMKLVGPALNGMATLVSALKEPAGKRKIEQMRSEFADSFEGLQAVMKGLEEALRTMEEERARQADQIRFLELQVAYLSLPFWKRWFTPIPSWPAIGIRDRAADTELVRD